MIVVRLLLCIINRLLIAGTSCLALERFRSRLHRPKVVMVVVDLVVDRIAAWISTLLFILSVVSCLAFPISRPVRIGCGEIEVV